MGQDDNLRTSGYCRCDVLGCGEEEHKVFAEDLHLDDDASWRRKSHRNISYDHSSS